MKINKFQCGSVIYMGVMTIILSGFLSCANANELILNKSKATNLASACSSGTCSGRTERPSDDRDER